MRPATCPNCGQRPPVRRDVDGEWNCDPCLKPVRSTTNGGIYRGYTGGDTAFTRRDAESAATNARIARRPAPVGSTGCSEKIPRGWVRVVVPCVQPDGTRLDRDEARQTLADRPWFADLQHVGSGLVAGVISHVFRRPGVKP